MKKKKSQLNPAVLRLPQAANVWYFSLRSAKSETDPQTVFVPLVLDVDTGELVGSNVYTHLPRTSDLLDILADCMLYPLTSDDGCRPALIEFEQLEVYQQITPYLTQAGIGVRYFERPELGLQGLEQALPFFENPQPAVLGLLEIEGNTEQAVGEFFAAAADFYRQAVWKMLDDTQPLALKIDPPGKEFFVILMGKAEIQYGLLFFESWDELMKIIAQTTQPMDLIPENGLKMISFEPRQAVPPQDLEAAARLGWKVAGEQAFPVPVIYTQDELLRPKPDQLARCTACLKAILHFSEQHLKSGKGEDFAPAEAEYPIGTTQGDLLVSIRYPAERIDEIEQLDRNQNSLEQQEDGDFPASGDKDYLRWLRLPDDPNIRLALELSRQAWEAQDADERVRLAKQALEHYAGCIRACVVLGEEAETVEEALAYFERGWRSGEKLLDPQLIEDYTGRLWDAPPARPYLVARQGFVECLVEQEEFAQARPHCEQILQLNPADHQGIRYALLYIYMKLNQDARAAELLERYAEEDYAGWPYTRALLAFRKNGDDPEAQDALHQALVRNSLVPEYLTGRRLIPEIDTQETDLDEEGEAKHYATDYFNVWWQTKGAVAWLKKHTA